MIHLAVDLSVPQHGKLPNTSDGDESKLGLLVSLVSSSCLERFEEKN